MDLAKFEFSDNETPDSWLAQVRGLMNNSNVEATFHASPEAVLDVLIYSCLDVVHKFGLE